MNTNGKENGRSISDGGSSKPKGGIGKADIAGIATALAVLGTPAAIYGVDYARYQVSASKPVITAEGDSLFFSLYSNDNATILAHRFNDVLNPKANTHFWGELQNLMNGIGVDDRLHTNTTPSYYVTTSTTPTIFGALPQKKVPQEDVYTFRSTQIRGEDDIRVAVKSESGEGRGASQMIETRISLFIKPSGEIIPYTEFINKKYTMSHEEIETALTHLLDAPQDYPKTKITTSILGTYNHNGKTVQYVAQPSGRVDILVH